MRFLISAYGKCLGVVSYFNIFYKYAVFNQACELFTCYLIIIYIIPDIYEVSRGPLYVNVNPIGCGFVSHSGIEIYNRGKMRHSVPLLNTQCLQYLAESEKRSALTQGSLAYPHMRDRTRN